MLCHQPSSPFTFGSVPILQGGAEDEETLDLFSRSCSASTGTSKQDGTSQGDGETSGGGGLVL